MARMDLLSLSEEDLLNLTNRGILNKARRELEENEARCELSESSEGEPLFRWSDGFECRFPVGLTPHPDHCSCPSESLCWHLIRSILYYQRHHAASALPATAAGSWDPGSIPDDELKRLLGQRLTRARQRYQEGVLVELHRSSKPTAHFHHPACTVRFPVPGDLRYAHCDCNERQPCSHAALAVWAFRKLPASQKDGILSTSDSVPELPDALLDRLESTLREYAELGISGVPASWKDRLARLEQECVVAGLIWPADILAELGEQQERYEQHDARFAPDTFLELLGELQARSAAIRANGTALPQLLIRGSGEDRPTSLARAAYLGLGCGARPGRKRVVLSSYLQDSDSGRVVAVVNEFPDPETASSAPGKPFSILAQTTACKGISFRALGGGKLVADGARPTARGHLKFGQRPISLYPDFHDWEQVRPPVRVESFAELEERLRVRPPSCLRARRLGEDFHLCPIAAVQNVHFDSVTQTVQAQLLDARGSAARLVFPYTTRGQGGAESLLARLGDSARSLCFVSGPVQWSSSGLVFEPVGLLFQKGSGQRELLQPWIEAGSDSVSEVEAPPVASTPGDPLGEFLALLGASLEALLLVGVQRADIQTAQRWRELQRRAEGLGLARLATELRPLADSLELKGHSLRWDARAAARLALRPALLLRLAQDVAH